MEWTTVSPSAGCSRNYSFPAYNLEKEEGKTKQEVTVITENHDKLF